MLSIPLQCALHIKQHICDVVDSLLTLIISDDNIEDLKNLIAVVADVEHTECS